MVCFDRLRKAPLYLRKLKLYGFKSFADRTELEFDPKLLAIVGPNGCGKSNIVDAILWGLGEHNPRNLRAESAADVIFAGSARRKGLGYAEVQLLFDNEDGALPFPAAEVAVTRRVTQDGQGEYLINGKSCRQKDIVDLFADTGLGRTGYAIVSQREVDAVLSAHPEVRRALLDEAAGVQRFRARREDTVKRLEQASYHLQRAQDLLNEIERQIKPMESQAADAIAYREARDRLRQLEVGLLLRDVHRLAESTKRLEADLGDLALELDRVDTAILEGEQRARVIADSVVDAEKELDRVRGLQQAAHTEAERADSKLALATQRLDSLRALLTSHEEHAVAAASEAQRLTEELARAEERLERAKQELAAHAPSLDAELLERLNAELAARLEELAAVRRAEMEYNRLEAERKQGVLQICRLRDEATELRRRQNNLSALSSELQQAYEQASNALSHAQVEAEAAAQEAEQLTEQRQQLLAEVASAEREHAARRATLQALHSAIPGDACGILLEQGLAEGAPRLAAKIRVGSEYRKALDAALGPSAAALLSQSPESADRLLDALATLDRGRGMVAYPTRAEAGHQEALRAEAAAAGALGLAEDFVEAEEPCRGVVRRLLHGIVVARDRSSARDLTNLHGDWRRIVTLSGEVIYREGLAEAGDFLGRVVIEAELREIAEQAEADKVKVEALQIRVREVEQSLGIALSKRSEANRRLEEAREAAEQSGAKVQEAQGELRFLSERVERLEAQIHEQSQRLQQDIEPVDPHAVEKLEVEISDLRAQIASLEADARRSDRDREVLAERVRETESEVARLKTRLAESEVAREEGLAKQQELTRQIEQAEAERLELEALRRAAEAAKQEADSAYEAARVARAELLEESFQATETVKSLRLDREAMLNRNHDLELERAKAEIRRSNALKSLAEEHEISEEEAEEMLRDFRLPEGAISEAAALRRELRRLGDVNLGAVEALEALKERRDSLVTQRDDLHESRDRILAAMQEIEAATKSRFLETFEAVSREFEAVFARLFAGGIGQLKLTNPDDVMSSGVDIEVQLPGKRRQKMELLSGGERALTAIALLFSLLRVRPSPLCILDEVDAPLDGRNVERFCEMLREFAEEMQFLVVTHNAVTIEAAQVWYGVTMQEPGVSTVVPFGRGARAVVSASV